MFNRVNTATKFAAIALLTVLVALSAIPVTNTYYASYVVRKGKDAHFYVTDNANGRVEIRIPKRSLDPYLAEKGLNQVEITCQLTEQWISKDDQSGYYRLDFTFGPSGTYFKDPLLLHIRGRYATSSTETWLYDANGETLVGNVIKNDGSQIVFEIPHFSRYSYDHYY